MTNPIIPTGTVVQLLNGFTVPTGTTVTTTFQTPLAVSNYNVQWEIAEAITNGMSIVFNAGFDGTTYPRTNIISNSQGSGYTPGTPIAFVGPASTNQFFELALENGAEPVDHHVSVWILFE